MDSSNPRDESLGNDSSLHNHRLLFKKQKSHSIVYGDPNQEVIAARNKNASLTGKAFGLKRLDPRNSGEGEIEKRIFPSDKLNQQSEIPNLNNIHKKNESFDKNIISKKQNTNGKKFFLNTSFKMFHFKTGSKLQESGSKRSPSFSNSNLPTEAPSFKACRTETLPQQIIWTNNDNNQNNQKSMITAHKIKIGSREKIVSSKPLYQSLFEDLKSYTLFKSSMNHNSKFIINLKYPFFFRDLNEASSIENEDRQRVDFLENPIFEQMHSKLINKWKDVSNKFMNNKFQELRKKIDGRRTRK